MPEATAAVETPATDNETDTSNADITSSDLGEGGGEEESAGDLFDQILNGTSKEPDEADDKKPVAQKKGVKEVVEGDVEPATGKKYEFESADGTKKMMTLSEAQKAWKSGGMMQADYTKKTQELKTEQRKLATEQMRLKSEESRLVGTARNIKAFIQELADPNLDPYRFIKMLESKGAPMKRHLGAILRDLDNERNMPEDQRAQIERERRQRVTQQEIAAEERRVEKVRQARIREEQEYNNGKTQQKVQAWSKAAFKDAGIEGSDVEVERLRARLKTVAQMEKRPLMYEDFVEAAKHVKNSVVEEIRKRSPAEIVAGLTQEQLREFNLAASKKLKELNGTAGNGVPATRKPAAPPARGPRTVADRVRDGY